MLEGQSNCTIRTKLTLPDDEDDHTTMASTTRHSMAVILIVAFAFLLHSATAAPAPDFFEVEPNTGFPIIDTWLNYWTNRLIPPKHKAPPERFHTCDENVTFNYPDITFYPWPDWVEIKDCKTMATDLLVDVRAPEQFFYPDDSRGRWQRLGHVGTCSFHIRARKGGFYFGTQDFIDIANTVTDTYPEYSLANPDFRNHYPGRMGPAYGTVGKCKPTMHNSTHFAEPPTDWVENIEWKFTRVVDGSLY